MRIERRHVDAIFGARQAPDGSLVADNFARWFGASAVVDMKGAPMIVFHGTSKDTDFDRFRAGARGIWFTADEEEASSYAEFNDSRQEKVDWISRKLVVKNSAARVLPVYLSLQRPCVMSQDDLARWRDHIGPETYAPYERRLFARLRAAGHDGVDWGNGVYVAFSACQVKSAAGNCGLFDASSDCLVDAHGWQLQDQEQDQEHEGASTPQRERMVA